MLPLAMGKGEFVAGLGAPFAITVIGGLTMSTLLTLVIIPTLYSGLEDALRRLRTQSVGMKILQLTGMVADKALSGYSAVQLASFPRMSAGESIYPFF